MSGQTWTWVGFILFVLSMLALDLGVFHRKSHEVTIREALAWSGVWIMLALLFNLVVYYWLGPEPVINAQIEEQRQNDPDAAPGQRLSDRHFVRLAMENAQVEGEHR